MLLNQIQLEKTHEILQNHLMSKSSDIELDNKRKSLIPTIIGLINEYINEKSDLSNFKTKNDSLNKQNEFWGFKGMSGQMFLNMLYNISQNNGYYEQLDLLLKSVIQKPKDINEANDKILSLMTFCDTISISITDRRGAPKKGSIPYFLSYFWSIQDNNEWPIYYTSMIKGFEKIGITYFDNEPNVNYTGFYQINKEVQKYYKDKNSKEISLWDIEHALYYIVNIPTVSSDSSTTKSDNVINGNEELPSSYIPPIVSILPELAISGDSMQILCQRNGISVEKLFEQRISILFKIMGFTVETLGQGYGRVPDGIAICSEYHYAIIFDAKVRKDGYTLGTDDRAIKEYILNNSEPLKRRGIKNVYFLIISSKFNSDFEDLIKNIKIETDIREILFIEVNALLLLLEQKLRSNEFVLGPGGLQNFLAQSGIITVKDIM